MLEGTGPKGTERKGTARFRLAGLLVCVLAIGAAHAEDWLPVSDEELRMTSEPKAPKAPAIFLYRQVDRNDTVPSEEIYERIKVLTDEGRKYADVEISYFKDSESIRSLEARLIDPDGTVVEFDGTVYDKPIVRSREYKMMAKTFTFPNVKVGSIIEYRYIRRMSYGWVFNSQWLLSQELFTRHARFSLRPSGSYALRWSWPLGLPAGTEPPKQEKGRIRLETHDVPAFVKEEFMPPENLMKYRVLFIYEGEESNQREAEKYWKAFGKRVHWRLRNFVKNHRSLEQAVAEIVQPEDSPEVKVRKIYTRVQQVRNLSFERARTEQEIKREKLADNSDAEDVWKHGYGDGIEVTWLFLALVRAAGIEADGVLVPTRDDYFFDPRLMNARQLNSNVVVVKLPDGEVFLDPGTPFTPFGLLPWSETAVTSMLLTPEGGKWITTPLPAPDRSRVDRKVTVKLSTDGTLEGKATVAYTGLEASWRRRVERNEDETDRREFLENDLQIAVPSGTHVKLTNSPDWASAEQPLVAEFDFKVPGWAAAAGRRLLMPVGLFGNGEKHTFEHGARVHPLYFNFPYAHQDEVAIELPAGWRVGSLPKPRASDLKTLKYGSEVKASDTSLSLKRELMLNLTLVQVNTYGTVRDFFQTVRAGDEDQIVLEQGAPPTAQTLH